MGSYTPINIWKLSRTTQEVLKNAKKISKFNVKNIYLNYNEFSEIIESISPAWRNFYANGIPFEGKLLVRK